MDMNYFLKMVYNLILERPCVVCNRKNICIAHCTTIGNSPSFLLQCMTSKCSWKYTIHCSGPWRGKVKELPARMLYSFVLAGLTYQNYEEVMRCMDNNGFSHNTWMKLVNDIDEICSNMLQSIINKNVESATGLDIIMSIDGGWSHRGWNANECSVAAFDLSTGALLDLEILVRKLPGDNKGNFEGPSCAMEGEGTKRICARLKEKGVNVAYIVHDRDGKTANIVKEAFPDVQEFNDGGHAANNFRKKIIALVKDFPEFKGLGATCLRSFIYCMKNCEGNKQEFEKMMKNQYNHICNLNHKHCTHSKLYQPKGWNFVTSENARAQLWKEIETILDRSEHYVHKYSSNICESFFNSRTKFISKRLNMRVQFQMRTKAAALKLELERNSSNEGNPVNWKELVLEELKLSPTLNQQENFFKETQKIVKQKKRYLPYTMSF